MGVVGIEIDDPRDRLAFDEAEQRCERIVGAKLHRQAARRHRPVTVQHRAPATIGTCKAQPEQFAFAGERGHRGQIGYAGSRNRLPTDDEHDRLALDGG
jgi:hypothetical protein